MDVVAAARSSVPPTASLVRVGKRYGGVVALADVSIDLTSGIHALVGENGAGKSTLLGILSGAVAPSTGDVLLNGELVRFRHPHDALAAGIATVHQQAALVPTMTVLENILLPRLGSRALALAPSASQIPPALDRLLADHAEDLGLNVKVSRLTPALRQLVEILKALSSGSRLLLLDEPTASLDAQESERLLAIAEGLRSENLSIVFVSHRPTEVLRIADRISVLRDGRLIDTVPRGSVTESDLIRMMVGREIPAREAIKRATGAARLDLRGVSSGSVVTDVTTTVREGEVVGIAGLLGSGRSELLEVVFGARRMSNGSIDLDGKQVHPSQERSIGRGVVYVPSDRHRNGLFANLTIDQNIAMSRWATAPWLRVVTRRMERGWAAGIARRLQLKASSLDGPVRSLSGGNQQKVLLARWLGTEPRVLLIDEPTEGVDMGTKSEIYGLIDDLAAGGTSCVVVSSELPELLRLCDRILVMRRGRLVAEFDGADATEELILAAAATGQNESEA